MLFLVLANGFFVAAEFALVSVRRTRIEQLVAEGNRRARSTLDALNHLDAYIAATQLGITMASLALGWIGEPALAHLFEPWLARLPFIPVDQATVVAHTLAVAIAFTIITTLHIVLGELAPKSIALQRSEGTALWIAQPMHWFLAVFRPAIMGLNTIGNAVVRLIGIQPAAGHALVQSAEELRLSVAAAREAGLVDEAAHDIVDRAFDFGELTVSEVMTPRTEVVGLPEVASLDDYWRTVNDSGHSRLPVYRGSLDTVVGILHVKDVWLALRREPSASDLNLLPLMRDPLVIPEGLLVAEALTRMKRSRTHLAVVIDEYGGTAGIVTLEDILESLIGEVSDEFEPAEPELELLGSDRYLVNGLMTIDEFNDRLGAEIADDDHNTIGGHVFGRLGRKPEIGDEIESAGYQLRVSVLDGLRIARLVVQRLAPIEENQTTIGQHPGSG
ncbi:MAG: HlyC/CorC family transporter [Chloroflexi bacterium]|nr:HlyC/CorC family transporter [Chloroflexota bacterium]